MNKLDKIKKALGRVNAQHPCLERTYADEVLIGLLDANVEDIIKLIEAVKVYRQDKYNDGCECDLCEAVKPFTEEQE